MFKEFKLVSHNNPLIQSVVCDKQPTKQNSSDFHKTPFILNGKNQNQINFQEKNKKKQNKFPTNLFEIWQQKQTNVAISHSSKIANQQNGNHYFCLPLLNLCQSSCSFVIHAIKNQIKW